MLKLCAIKKIYNLEKVRSDGTSANDVVALKGINLEFRESEFVSILGPSGCGKTTMLNIVGGLDRYTSGDLLIDDKSTKSFTDSNWDAYRNNAIGFVFQSYNLISHQTVLSNVEIALTLSGVSGAERKKRAEEALIKVGLGDKLNSKPNQLSGGQMQRVAIARALVNNPKIILADEPSGALDSQTSEQIMEILKEISKDKLIIMVTHNQELAHKYSTRIVSLKDGEIISDTKPYDSQKGAQTTLADAPQKMINKKTSMSFLTALKLSLNNLFTKKVRTIITSFAGSIGIIGIALVLAIGAGMNSYIAQMQSDTLAGLPITIEQTYIDISGMMDAGPNFNNNQNSFPDTDEIYPSNPSSGYTKTNKLSMDYVDYLNGSAVKGYDGLDPKLYNSIVYSYSVSMMFISKNDQKYTRFSGNTGLLEENADFGQTQYTVLKGKYPSNHTEIAIVLNENNVISSSLLQNLGLIDASFDYQTTVYKFDDFLNKKIMLVDNNNRFQKVSEKSFVELPNNVENNKTMYDNAAFELTIVGVLRVSESSTISNPIRGIGYLPSLTRALLDINMASEIVLAQKDYMTNVVSGIPFADENAYTTRMRALGGDDMPTSISIYPVSFESKDLIKEYLDAYNTGKNKEDRIIYTDLAAIATNMVTTLINTISIVLSAFAGISLVVSSIMIGIITYVSVIERTKEIGVLRSLGARKKDISRVFNAETVIIGFTAGIIGVIITLLLSIPVNIIVGNLTGVSPIATLQLWTAVGLIVISITLTLIAGLFPSRIAANKDPVVALRVE